MALSGIQIYKLLPQTNCKECGFPTCLAFAMKLAAKQTELSACPYVTEESKTQLAESAAPPIRMITLKSDGYEVKAGNEVVLFRHEKTFYNKPGLFVTVRDDEPTQVIKEKVRVVDAYSANYVGINLTVDGFAIRSTSSGEAFLSTIQAIREVSKRPLILISSDPSVMEKGLSATISGEHPMLVGTDQSNWEPMA